MSDNRIAAIRADGQPVGWQAEEPAFLGSSPQPAVAVAANQFEGSDLVWLDRVGTLHQSSGLIPIEGRTVHFCLSRNLLMAIGDDGTRTFLGKERAHPHFPLAFFEPDLVQHFDAGSIGFIDVLYKDGQLFRVEKETVKPFGNRLATHLYSHNLGWADSGAFYSRGVEMPIFDGIPEAPTSAFTRGGVAAIERDGERSFYERNPTGWSSAPLWDEALAGAVDVYQESTLYVHALLPADLVPRSGIWPLEDLANHRRANP